MDLTELLEPGPLAPPGYPDALDLEEEGLWPGDFRGRSMAANPDSKAPLTDEGGETSEGTLVEEWQPRGYCCGEAAQTSNPAKRRALRSALTSIGVLAVVIVLIWMVVRQEGLRQTALDLEGKINTLEQRLEQFAQDLWELEGRTRVHAGTWRRKRDAEWGPEKGWKENWEWKRPRRPKKVRLPSSTTMTPSAIPVTPSPTPSQAPTRTSMESKGTSVPGWSSTLAPWGLSRRTRSTDPAPAPATTTLASPDPSTGQAGESANGTEVMCRPMRTLTTLAPEDTPRTRRPPLSTRTVPLTAVVQQTTATTPHTTEGASFEPASTTTRTLKAAKTTSTGPPLTTIPTPPRTLKAPEDMETTTNPSTSVEAATFGSGQAELASTTRSTTAS